MYIVQIFMHNKQIIIQYNMQGLMYLLNIVLHFVRFILIKIKSLKHI